MSKKSDRTLSEALGGGEAFRRLKKAVKQVLRPSDDKIERILEQITSIQACKDAAYWLFVDWVNGEMMALST